VRYGLLGRSGLRVSELCLGAMTFGGAADRDESRRIFETYREAGGNFVDTANNYSGGASEEILGELLADRRDEIVLATKYTAPTRPGDLNSGGNHRKALVQSLDASLARLKTDYVDLYWVHVWDVVTPLEELMRALDDAVRAGKVLYVGISDAPAWVVARANTLAELRGWTPFAGLQIEHSLIERTVESELVPMARALGLSVLAWGPLGGGLLSGKYLEEAPPDEPRRLSEGDRRLTERNLVVARTVTEVAADVGATPAQVALAWLRAQAGVIPILGARTSAQLEESLGCMEVALAEDQLERLDEVSRVPLGFPHEFLEGLRQRYAAVMPELD
jgi:aryl-alcohol dehydrogenase-like predicted oxidoreductase